MFYKLFFETYKWMFSSMFLIWYFYPEKYRVLLNCTSSKQKITPESKAKIQKSHLNKQRMKENVSQTSEGICILIG